MMKKRKLGFICGIGLILAFVISPYDEITLLQQGLTILVLAVCMIKGLCDYFEKSFYRYLRGLKICFIIGGIGILLDTVFLILYFCFIKLDLFSGGWEDYINGFLTYVPNIIAGLLVDLFYFIICLIVFPMGFMFFPKRRKDENILDDFRGGD